MSQKLEFKQLPITNTQSSSNHKDTKPENAIDGKADTQWQAKGKGEYLVIDLGKEEKVARLSIKWYESDLRRMTYELFSSKDGKNYRRIGACVSSGVKANEYEDHDFERPIEARYFKIVGYGNTLNSFISIVDVKAFSLGFEVSKTAEAVNPPTTESEGKPVAETLIEPEPAKKKTK